MGPKRKTFKPLTTSFLLPCSLFPFFLLQSLVSTSPEQARTLLSSHPQLAYALFQAMLMMNIVDQPILQRILVASGAAGGQALPPQPPAQNPYGNQPQFAPPQQGNGTPPQHNMYSNSNPTPGSPPPPPQRNTIPTGRPPVYGQPPPQIQQQPVGGPNLGEEQRVSRFSPFLLLLITLRSLTSASVR